MRSCITGRIEEYWKEVCQRHKCKYYIHQDYPSCSYCSCPDDNCILMCKNNKNVIEMAESEDKK